MTKITVLVSSLIALFMLTGCGDGAKIECDTIQNVRNGVDEALSKDYKHITIAKDIKISIPEQLYTYQPKGALFLENENDPKIKSVMELLYDPDDFDKEKNPDEEIFTMHLTDDRDDPAYQFFNETKDEHAIISHNGYIHLGPNELLDYEVLECEYIDRIPNDEVHQKVLTAANAKMEEAVRLQNNFEMRPYLCYKVKSYEGNAFYGITYCRLMDDVLKIPFGTDGATNIDITDNGASNLRWFSQDVTVFVDESFTVRSLHIDSLSKADRKDTIKKIATLDSVLNYISKKIAPNYTVEITNIQLMYAQDSAERTIFPVWYIEFKNNSIDISEYNRFIINADTGLVCSYINGSYSEAQG